MIRVLSLPDVRIVGQSLVKEYEKLIVTLVRIIIENLLNYKIRYKRVRFQMGANSMLFHVFKAINDHCSFSV